MTEGGKVGLMIVFDLFEITKAPKESDNKSDE